MPARSMSCSSPSIMTVSACGRVRSKNPTPEGLDQPARHRRRTGARSARAGHEVRRLLFRRHRLDVQPRAAAHDGRLHGLDARRRLSCVRRRADARADRALRAVDPVERHFLAGDRSTASCKLFADYYNTIADGVVNDRWLPMTSERDGTARSRAAPALDALPQGAHEKLGEQGRDPATAAALRFPHAGICRLRPHPTKKWEATRGMSHSFGYNRRDTEADYESVESLVQQLHRRGVEERQSAPECRSARRGCADPGTNRSRGSRASAPG